MSTANELFTTASGVDEAHIVINSDRSVSVPDELKNIAVQYDHNIETVTFDCPRYWDVRTDEGYLMYDTDVEDIEIDENGNEVPVTYYYSRACIPATYDFNTFSYIAVPRDSVDPKYILNDPNKPEIM